MQTLRKKYRQAAEVASHVGYWSMSICLEDWKQGPLIFTFCYDELSCSCEVFRVPDDYCHHVVPYVLYFN